MRLSDSARFPHPVLAPSTGDYQAGQFTVDISIEEDPDTGSALLRYKAAIDQPALQELISGGSAIVGLFVVCRRTYYNQLHPFESESLQGEINFAPGELRETVSIRPVICSVEPVPDYVAADLHAEFTGVQFNLAEGQILALGEEQRFDAGLDKLAPMESVFELVRDEAVPPSQIRVSVEEDKIAIMLSGETYDTLGALRGSRAGQIQLLSGVYLPAVMEVLGNVTGDTGGLEGNRWYRVFEARCAQLGIDMQNIEPLRDAQNMLKSPLEKLLKLASED